MVVAVIKPFGWYEVKECKDKPEAIQWWIERCKKLLHTHPTGVALTLYEVSEVTMVGGSP